MILKKTGNIKKKNPSLSNLGKKFANDNVQIHIKDNDNNNRKYVNHTYKEFETIIEYLDKFEWFNNAAFQNKQLPSKKKKYIKFLLQLVKFLTPICFWFIICYNYFPRFILKKNQNTLIEAILNKCSKIIPETKLRLNKNMIKGIQKNEIIEEKNENEDEDFVKNFNHILAKSIKNCSDDTIQRMYEKKEVHKANYSLEDDIFLLEVNKFLSQKKNIIQNILKNSKFESIQEPQNTPLETDKQEEINPNNLESCSLKESNQIEFDLLNHIENQVENEKAKIIIEQQKIEEKIEIEETEKKEEPEKENIIGNDNQDIIEKQSIINSELVIKTIDLGDEANFEEKIEKNIKKITLSNLISLYSQELLEQQQQNNSIISEMKENFKNEKKSQEIFNVDDISYDEMLADIVFFTNEELEYLSLLENKQQNLHMNKPSPLKVLLFN